MLVRALVGRGIPAVVVSVDDVGDAPVDAQAPDVVLVDGDGDAAQLERMCAEIRRALPEAKLLLLTAAGADQSRRTAARTDADGVVKRATGLDGVIAAIGASGRQRRQPQHSDARHRNDPHQGGIASLTSRETQVLRLVATGAHNSEVALRLDISPHTVRTHVANVLAKLGAENRLAAAAMARRAGILPAGPDTARAFEVSVS